jgi:hypothetical protein
MASTFIDGELLAEDLEFLSDREQELLSGGGGSFLIQFNGPLGGPSGQGDGGLTQAFFNGAPLIEVLDRLSGLPPSTPT